MRHQGCLRYAFLLGRRCRLVVALAAEPYPKVPDLGVLERAA